MKAKLIKHGYDYAIIQNDKMVAFSSDDYTNDHLIGKLSKQNCDEIFGVVDFEKLAENKYGKGIYEIEQVDAYVEGFNKAMELNKDKVFTLEDVKKAYIQGKHGGKTQAYVEFDDYIQSLQQPTEIEVEIVMGDSIGISDLYTPDNKPKLDSEGCFILTKKI